MVGQPCEASINQPYGPSPIQPSSPSSIINPCTPPPETLDDSETLLKQPFIEDPPVSEDGDQIQETSETPSLGDAAGISTPVTNQCVTFEREDTPVTPGVSCGTRSKKRQTQITDSFTSHSAKRTNMSNPQSDNEKTADSSLIPMISNPPQTIKENEERDNRPNTRSRKKQDLVK